VGRILFGALGQLRGTALKVSQLLSMHPTLLPEGVRRELARAQHQALPLNRALVGRVFRQAFGQEPEALFAHFEPMAFAAASLGQVHRAQLPGEGLVAVKVQYPASPPPSPATCNWRAARALARTDLPLPADSVVDGDGRDRGHAAARGGLPAGGRATAMVRRACRAARRGDGAALLSHTRAQVLTQQYLPGLHLDAWLATQPQQALRDRAGQHLWDWFMHCIFGLGRVRRPAPRQLPVRRRWHGGRARLRLHAGALGRLSTQMARAWSALLRPATDPQRDALVLQAYQALGLAGPDLALATYSAELAPTLADMQAWQLEPFTQAVFDFSTKQPPPITPPSTSACWGAIWRRCRARCPRSIACGWA
jgi:hypothetical protein